MVKTIKIKDLSSKIYYPSGEVKKVVIGIHGFGGDKESSVLVAVGKSFENFNTALVVFDLPCHGENDNSKPLDLDECIDSVKTVYEFASSEFSGIPVSFFATSFGGYLLLAFLQKYKAKCDKIILRAPAIFMGSVLKNIIIPEHGYTTNELKTKALNLGYEKQVLVDQKFFDELFKLNLENFYKQNYFLNVLQGKKDTTVSPIDNERFFKTNCEGCHKIYYFDEADHRFKKPGEVEKIIEITKSILIQNG